VAPLLMSSDPVGFTVSIFTVSSSEFVFPALSATEQLTECEPSPETGTEYGLEEPVTVAVEPPTTQSGAPPRPLVASETVTEPETGEAMFQSLAPSAVCETEI